MATTTCPTIPATPTGFVASLSNPALVIPGSLAGPAFTADVVALLALLAQISTLGALCATFCTDLLACTLTGTGFTAGLTLTSLLTALTTFFATNPASTESIGVFVGALGLATATGGLAPVVAALQTCINNALAGCFAACPPTTPGNLFCPGFASGGSPISIQITNTARNDDQDQITTQAGKANNAAQDQKFITAAAGDDVVINGFKKRFDEFDEKLRFLLCKLKEDNKKPCKCKKTGCKY